MRREIKFRVWDKVEKEWKPFANFDIVEWQMYDMNPVEEYDFQQFIGLKDKNGKDIYEGDIIQYQYGSYQSPKYDKVVVKWISENDGYDYTGWKLVDTFQQGGECEIIGNIFKTPELLKQ